MRDQIEGILEQLKGLPDNPAVLEDADLLTFVISLLPLPGVQQAGQIANRIVVNRSLNTKLTALKDEIHKTNEKIANLEDGIQRVGAFALTAESVAAIETMVRDMVNAVVEELGESTSEFSMETSDWSMQVLIKQIVEADLVSISAIRGSQNILSDTKVRAKKTRLRAHDHSTNILDGTEIGDDSGSVGFRGIGQTGDVSVGPNSIGFHGTGGSLNFGAKPDTVSADCPACTKQIIVERHSLVGKTHVKCPHCGGVFPFN